MGRQVATLGDDAKGLYKGIIHTLIASGAGYLCVVTLELVLHAIDNVSTLAVKLWSTDLTEVYSSCVAKCDLSLHADGLRPQRHLPNRHRIVRPRNTLFSFL